MHVVCTAGHVDHGKSTLVRALTGMEPDRWAEERRRGLTIDLGFAWTELAAGGRRVTVAFVDLPGHERFVANMLAGAGAVRVALFVVAADEGWMPQSQEHLDILDLLGVSSGVVALAKADAVDQHRLAEVQAQVTARLAPTALAGADVLAVSAVSGAGLEALVARLLAVLEGNGASPDAGHPRLWVDRSFTIRGAGTVVTGTLAGGRLQTGDEVAILPAGLRCRIRGLQSLKSAVTVAPAGSRVAVNLAGVERTQVGRGDALGRDGHWAATATLDVWARALPEHALSRRGSWHLHAGSGEWLARLNPLGGAAVTGEGYLRVRLDRPAPLVAGDRFVLRDAGRRATAGGGLVLDPLPLPLRGPTQRAARIDALRRRLEALDDRSALLALHLAERGADHRQRAAAAVGLAPEAVAAAVRSRRLLALGPALVDPKAAAGWSEAVVAAVRGHHRAHPVERTAPRPVAVRAAASAGCAPELTAPLLDRLARLGRVVADGPGLRDPGHAVRLDPGQARARQALLDTLDAEPFAPPGLADAARRAGVGPALLRELETAGDLVRLTPDLAMTSHAVAEAAHRLREAYAREGPLTAARAKTVLGTTRKYALPLLEELDRRGVTRRRGDLRDVRAAS